MARLALVAGTLVCMAAVGEVFLRCFVELEGKRSAIYDPELGWRGRPNSKGLYILKKDGVRTGFRYNNLGYRDEDVLPKENGEKRILFLGDSFLENLEVEYQDVFHEILETRLKESDDAYEAVAIGSQGYSNSQQLLAFRRYQDIVKPELVLTAFYTGNDFEDNERRRFAYLDDNDQLVFPENHGTPAKLRKEAFKRWLYESSHLVYWLKNKIQMVANLNLGDPSKSVNESNAAYQERITRALLLKLDEEVTAFGGKHAIVIFPSKDELAENDLTRIRLIADLCSNNGIPYLDLSDSLSAEHYLTHDFHFTVQGHAFVAGKMLEFLQTEFSDLLPKAIDRRVASRKRS